MTLFTEDQIRLLLKRLRWEPVYEEQNLLLAKKRGIGYSDDPDISAIEARLSILLEVAAKGEK